MATLTIKASERHFMNSHGWTALVWRSEKDSERYVFRCEHDHQTPDAARHCPDAVAWVKTMTVVG